MKLSTLIRRYCAELLLVDPIDWNSIASLLSAPSETVRTPKKSSSAESLEALIAAQCDPNHAIAGVSSVPTGQMLLATLNSQGVDWGHPLTQTLLQELVTAGAVTAIEAGALTRLNLRLVSPAAAAEIPDPTADECRAAYLTELLEARIVNAVALANERLTTDMSTEVARACWAKCWEDAV